MSKRLLVRADDLGFSEAVNYGIERTLHTGIVRSVGVMANMPAAEHGVRLLSGHDVAVGLHACISAGEPLSDSSLVPSLVESTGQFHGSAAYRAVEEDFVSFEEAYREIRLQVDQLKSLLGRLPDYIDIHAVLSPSFLRAAAAVAEELGLPVSLLPDRGCDSMRVGGSIVRVLPMRPAASVQDARKHFLDGAASISLGETAMAICHPGYLDAYIMEHSSLTESRTYEAEALSSAGMIDQLARLGIELIDYRVL